MENERKDVTEQDRLADAARELINANMLAFDLKAKLTEANSRKSQASKEVCNIMAENGIQRVSLDGHTVYLHSIARPSHPSGGMAEAVDALRESGLGDMVTEGYHHGTVGAWMREQEIDEDGFPVLPKEFGKRLTAVIHVDARVRRGN